MRSRWATCPGCKRRTNTDLTTITWWWVCRAVIIVAMAQGMLRWLTWLLERVT